MREESKFIQGFYKPQNPKKYAGNPEQIVYRSSYELKAFKWCDLTENIISWGSEEISIRYYDPTTQKIRRYYPDLIIKIQESSGNINKYIIEIKPYRQTIRPSSTRKKKTKTFISEAITYERNQSKWEAAKKFCEENGFIFKIITEHELGIK